jgi:hypothetical protein
LWGAATAAWLSRSKLRVERSADGAPPGGEHLRADAVFGREEGDDVIEDAVGEAADDVLAAAFFFFFLESRLLGSGEW